MYCFIYSTGKVGLRFYCELWTGNKIFTGRKDIYRNLILARAIIIMKVKDRRSKATYGMGCATFSFISSLEFRFLRKSLLRNEINWLKLTNLIGCRFGPGSKPEARQAMGFIRFDWNLMICPSCFIFQFNELFSGLVKMQTRAEMEITQKVNYLEIFLFYFFSISRPDISKTKREACVTSESNEYLENEFVFECEISCRLVQRMDGFHSIWCQTWRNPLSVGLLQINYPICTWRSCNRMLIS